MSECVVSLPTVLAQEGMLNQYSQDVQRSPELFAFGVTEVVSRYLDAVEDCSHRLIPREGTLFGYAIKCDHPERPLRKDACPLAQIEDYRTRLKPYIRTV